MLFMYIYIYVYGIKQFNFRKLKENTSCHLAFQIQQ